MVVRGRHIEVDNVLDILEYCGFHSVACVEHYDHIKLADSEIMLDTLDLVFRHVGSQNECFQVESIQEKLHSVRV